LVILVCGAVLVFVIAGFLSASSHVVNSRCQIEHPNTKTEVHGPGDRQEAGCDRYNVPYPKACDDGKVPCPALLWWASLVVASICFYLQASIIAQTKESLSIDNVQLLTIASRGAEMLVGDTCMSVITDPSKHFTGKSLRLQRTTTIVTLPQNATTFD
jgi:hypothetical protein